MTITKKPTTVAAIVMAFGLMTAPAAVMAQGYEGGAQGQGAQGQGGQSQGYENPAQSQAGAADFNSEDLEAYAVAFLDVRDISQEYQAKMQQAETPDDQQAIQQEAVEKMSGAVRDSGLSVDKYNQITEASRTDPELQQKVMDTIAEAQE